MYAVFHWTLTLLPSDVQCTLIDTLVQQESNPEEETKTDTTHENLDSKLRKWLAKALKSTNSSTETSGYIEQLEGLLLKVSEMIRRV